MDGVSNRQPGRDDAASAESPAGALTARLRLALEPAGPGDAPALAGLHAEVARRLTRDFGPGHWSASASERGVSSGMKRGTVYVARRRGRIVATLALSTRKPWAIEKSYFSPAARSLYLTSMAIDPTLQRQGIGRHCMTLAARIARDRGTPLIYYELLL